MLAAIKLPKVKAVGILVVTMRKPFTIGQYIFERLFCHDAADLAVCPSKWQA
jgi:hypothetical protein